MGTLTVTQIQLKRLIASNAATDKTSKITILTARQWAWGHRQFPGVESSIVLPFETRLCAHCLTQSHVAQLNLGRGCLESWCLRPQLALQGSFSKQGLYVVGAVWPPSPGGLVPSVPYLSCSGVPSDCLVLSSVQRLCLLCKQWLMSSISADTCYTLQQCSESEVAEKQVLLASNTFSLILCWVSICLVKTLFYYLSLLPSEYEALSGQVFERGQSSKALYVSPLQRKRGVEKCQKPLLSEWVFFFIAVVVFFFFNLILTRNFRFICFHRHDLICLLCVEKGKWECCVLLLGVGRGVGGMGRWGGSDVESLFGCSL